MSTSLKRIAQAPLILLLLLLPTKPIQAVGFDEAKLSITFDDGFASTYNYALPILKERNIKAAVFVTTDYAGKPGYMSWAQIQALQNTYGWEIGNHTATHPELPLLNTTKIRSELIRAKEILTNHGLNISSFATPYGAYDNSVLIESAKIHNLHRGFWDRHTNNAYPYNRSVITVKSVETNVPPQQVKTWIEQAKAENTWLVLVFHEVLPTQDPGYAYITTVTDFVQITDYIVNSGINVVLPAHILVKPDRNLFTSNSFTKGISEGWSTDNSITIKLDKNNNGSYPSPRESIILTGSNRSSHLYSNIIKVNSGSTYTLEIFINADGLTSGDFGFYMDEYDGNGNWISGQWLGNIYPKTVLHFARKYQPTSPAVTSFRLQTYISAGAKGKVYVDNYEIYTLVQGTNTPILPGKPPVQENLLLNGSFEELALDWAEHWERDSVSFKIDTHSMGDNGTNSLNLIPTIESAHTFSEFINAEYGRKYIWKQYISAAYISGEFGFYIDEYNESDSWISGQWKGNISSNFSGVKEISYTPTSNLVKKIRLQYYATAGSNIELFLDSVHFSVLNVD